MPKSVLIVDDEPLLARTLANALRDVGFDAVTAESVEQAEQVLFPQNEFVLVVLDHKLPRATGLSLLERMRAEEMRTPVVLMTAYETTTMHARALELSVDGFFRKPFNLAEMLDRIEQLVGPSGVAQPSPAE